MMEWKGISKCIFRRLGKIVMNQSFLGIAGQVKIEYLARIGSDHVPLLLSCGGQSMHFRKPFKFLNFGVDQSDFKGGEK